MKTTTNLGLKKIELSDSPPDITVQDANWDLIDKQLYNTVKYQKASGTGTAIVLADVTLTDGFCKTFIATSNNNGAATTINGKPLYKPGGTSVPKLIAGKAVTIWYDTAGDCFFIKASAEGDAVAGNVLAGKTFSNDDDIELTGTLAPRVPNLIKRGDFSSQNCWDSLNATIDSVTGNVLSFTPSAQYGRVHQRGPIIIANHKYFARIEVYGRGDAYLEFVNNSQQGSTGNHSSVLQWETLTCITALSTTDTSPGIFRVSSSLTSGWTQIKVRNAMLIDMTEAFGPGKELTTSQMEALIAAAGGYWHNILSKLIPDTTAIASKVLSNEIFYDTNGSRIVGTMPDKTGTTNTATGSSTGPSTGYVDIPVPTSGYYDTAAKLRIYDIDFEAKRVPAYTNFFGLQGTQGPRVPNLIKNGSFINQNCWDSYLSTVNSVTGNILTFTATAQYGRIYQTCDPVIANHKYYFRAEISGNNEAYISIIWNTTGTGSISAYHSNTVQFETLSCLVTPNANGDMLCRPCVLSQASSGWAQIKVKAAMFIDLTASFGAGFEPTQAEMDALIAYTGWWNSQLPILMSDANVSATDVLAGKVFYSNAGSKLSGTMVNQTGVNTVANSVAQNGTGTIQFVPPAGYYDGSTSTVRAGDPDFIASNLANGVNAFGLIGTMKRVVSGSANTSIGVSNFMQTNGSLIAQYYLNITGLTFKPRVVMFLYVIHGTGDYIYYTLWHDASFNGSTYCFMGGFLIGGSGYVVNSLLFKGGNGESGSTLNVDATSFKLPASNSAITTYWFAGE